MAAPLEGIKVVDLTRALAGPYCAMMLGDMGADVIKVEEPGGGDISRSWGPPFLQGESSYFLSLNRNKKSLTLNLKSDDARKILWRLVETADVFVENFSPGVVDKLGFPYPLVREANPKIVYCSISGFGQTGPYRSRPAFDQILQGLGGLMSITGPLEGPPTRVGIPLIDIATGMFAAFATVSALFHRAQTGQGQYVDTSLLEGEMALLTYQAGRYLATGEAPGLSGNRHPSIVPYESYKAADGYFNVAVGSGGQWTRFCESLGLPELVCDERFACNADRLSHRDELAQLVEQKLSTITCAEALRILEEAGVPCGPILNIKQTFEDPQVQHLGVRQTVDHPTIGPLDVVGMPYRFSETPGSIRKPPPLVGQHTEEILESLRYSPQDVDQLRKSGAI